MSKKETNPLLFVLAIIVTIAIIYVTYNYYKTITNTQDQATQYCINNGQDGYYSYQNIKGKITNLICYKTTFDQQGLPITQLINAT